MRSNECRILTNQRGHLSIQWTKKKKQQQNKHVWQCCNIWSNDSIILYLVANTSTQPATIPADLHCMHNWNRFISIESRFFRLIKNYKHRNVACKQTSREKSSAWKRENVVCAAQYHLRWHASWLNETIITISKRNISYKWLENTRNWERQFGGIHR